MQTISLKTYFYSLLTVLGAVLFWLALDAPVDVDEILHNTQAKKVVAWYASGGADAACLDTPTSFLKYYGQSVDNLAATVNHMFNISNEYQTRHLIGWVIGVLLLWFAGLLSVELTGSYGVGMLAMLFLFFSPRPMGQAIDNLKDIPFALGYAWSVLCLIRVLKQLPEFKWKTVIGLGVAIAFTNSVRIGGLIFFPYAALLVFLWFAINYSSTKYLFHDVRFWKRMLLGGGIVVLIGYFGGLLFWPYGLISPLKHPIESLTMMQKYAVSIRQLFEGEIVWSTSLPWYYLPKWLFISIPEIVWLGLILMVFVMVVKHKGLQLKNLFTHYAIWFFLLFPIVYVIVIGANLYSGWRQMYFIYVPLVVLSASGFYHIWKLLKKRTSRIILGLVIAAGLALPISHFIQTQPLHYIYFNNISGGNKNAWNNYEYDYYWMGMKEATDFLKEETVGQNNLRIASNFNVSIYFHSSHQSSFKYLRFQERALESWDYAIFGINYVHPAQIENGSWKPGGIIKTIYRKGHPIAVVLKSQGREGSKAGLAVKEGNHSQALKHYASVLDYDPNNIDVLARKAASHLALGEMQEFHACVKEGMSLNPFYEPFYLLLAQEAFNGERFDESIKYGEKLLEINKRYEQILPLLKKAYLSVGEDDKAKEIDKYINKYRLNINF